MINKDTSVVATDWVGTSGTCPPGFCLAFFPPRPGAGPLWNEGLQGQRGRGKCGPGGSGFYDSLQGKRYSVFYVLGGGGTNNKDLKLTIMKKEENFRKLKAIQTLFDPI